MHAKARYLVTETTWTVQYAETIVLFAKLTVLQDTPAAKPDKILVKFTPVALIHLH